MVAYVFLKSRKEYQLTRSYYFLNEICSHARVLVNFVQETVINKDPYLEDSCAACRN